jgi:hypothetical protein
MAVTTWLQLRIFNDKRSAAGKNGRMSSQSLGLRVAGILFGVIFLGHLWRLIRHSAVQIGSHSIPMWVSVVGLIVAGGLSIWMWRLSSSRGG